jgi:hypothetical protein
VSVLGKLREIFEKKNPRNFISDPGISKDTAGSAGELRAATLLGRAGRLQLRTNLGEMREHLQPVGVREFTE